jgi:hypothetical protein
MFDCLASCILVACGNYNTITINVTPKSITILQIMYNFDKYNHARWLHFHYSLNMTFAIRFQF